MECLLCDIRCFTQEVLKNHYQSYHFVDTEDQYFKDLFLPDTIEKTCKSCNLTFKNCRTKKITCFYFIILAKIKLVEVDKAVEYH